MVPHARAHARARARAACGDALAANMPSCAATLKELGGALEQQFQLPADLARGPVLPPGIACEPMPAQRSMRTGLLELQLCRNATHGLLVAEYSNATERVALLRIGGPHPQTAIFERSAAGQPPAGTRPRWVAPFRTCTPGTYTVHVLFVTLDPWGQGQMGFMRQCNIHHTDEAVLMRNASFAVGEGTAAPALSDTARAACRECMWSWPETTRDWEARSLFSNFAPTPHPYRFELQRRFGELSWHNPELAAAKGWWREAPPASLPLCLIGDSHMRNLANQIVATNRSDCDAVAMQETKSVCNGSSATRLVRFFRANEAAGVFLLTKRNASATRLHACRAIVASFGQWQVSDERSLHGLAPYSVERYATKLVAVLKWLRNLGNKLNVPVAWMSINPMPLSKGTLSNYVDTSTGVAVRRKIPTFAKRGSKTVLCPPTHWCMPHILAALNAAAAQKAAAADVPFLDTWHIVFQLIDTSFDGAHFGFPTMIPVTAIIKNWMRTWYSPALQT